MDGLTTIAARLLEWYQRNARQMPWRGHPDPYAVWVSEVMLQQTRVETVKPYFERWMRAFPSIPVLAAADVSQVLREWEGLGYYRRARNLHRAAQILVEEHGGELPRQVSDLLRLPGVGAYTAGAIASIAFGLDEPALDGNARRVLARVFNVEIPVDSGVGQRRLWQLAREHLPSGRAGAFNQALMELGALCCTPRDPDCARCPLESYCEAAARGVQGERPILRRKVKVPHHIVTAAVIQRNGEVLIAQRPLEGLLGGLWEFPGGKLEAGEDLQTCLKREIAEELGVQVEVGEALGVYRHAYTHFRVTLHAFWCKLGQEEPRAIGVADLRWVVPEALAAYPMGKIDRKIAERVTSDG